MECMRLNFILTFVFKQRISLLYSETSCWQFLKILRKQSPPLFGEEAFSSLKHSSIKYIIMLFGTHNKYFFQRRKVNGNFKYIILPLLLSVSFSHYGVITIEGQKQDGVVDDKDHIAYFMM